MSIQTDFRQPFGALAVLLTAAACASSPAGDPSKVGCDFESTFGVIEREIFVANGCTSSACHGHEVHPAGGLDLRAGHAFESLVRVPARAAAMDLVFPGDEERSLLYVKLASKTLRRALPPEISGAAMPFGEQLPALTEEELEVVRAWIRGGAPTDTVIEGTEDLLGCEGPVEVDPNKIEPLEPPPPEVGVQFYAGGWRLPAEAEDEVCYATYYDFSDVLPDEVKIPCPPNWGEGRECFTYGRDELAQDAQSHHSIINVFTRDSDPNGGEWGEWECLGGARDGMPCNPTEKGVCGERSACATRPETSIACIGYAQAPVDFAAGLDPTDVSPCEGQEGCEDGPWQIALSGAQESTFISDMTEGVYAVIPVNGFISWNSHGFNLTTKPTTIEQWVNVDFVYEDARRWEREVLFDARRLFAMTPIAPFEKKEVCMTFTLPQHARMMALSSHMHERGELFRIWSPPNAPCTGGSLLEADPDCFVPETEPLYTNRLYNDPVNMTFDPALPALDDQNEASRTFKACAVFDNGADDPMEVKRHSNALDIATCGELFAGCGCEPRERHCLGGPNEGMPCHGDDSACGAGGVCDACPLLGGSTTEDEMFLPFGLYYIETPG